MGKKVKEYKSGDFIFAKVKGYPAWPARVQKLNGKKYFVYFYGTGETANLPPNMIFDYAENKDKFLTKTVKRRDFNDGVKQIEHDFANNVPLEQVIGTQDDLPTDSMNDTANDSANDTMDDSAIDTTTADDTVADTTASNVTQNDTAVEDSDDQGALVIDEGKAPQPQKPNRKSKLDIKTPAKEAVPAKLAKTPRGKAKKDDREEEETEERPSEEIVSRSGRKIRPKRYIDEQTEENTTLPSPAPKKRRGTSPAPENKEKENKQEITKEKPAEKNIKHFNNVGQTELEDLKEPFKPADAEKDNILIAYLPSGQYVGLKLFQSRPQSFKDEAVRLQWDRQAASNAIQLKMQLEKGHITPQSIMAQLVMDLNLTDEEKASLDKERETEEKRSRVQFLKTEMKLIELDAKIKTCLCLEKADTDLCLKLLDELMELEIKPLMLLKHPTCLETIKRMRAYVGNTPSWDLSEGDALQFSKQAHRIRKQADTFYKNMKELFTPPKSLSFWEYFSERVLQFKKATSSLSADELLEIIHEPLEMSVSTSHTMQAAIEAANEEEPPLEEDKEEPQQKKKNNAKPKKAINTPTKAPLKRQNSRKQLQEEKEKEKEVEKEQSKEDSTQEQQEKTDEPQTAEITEPEKETLNSITEELEKNDTQENNTEQEVAETQNDKEDVTQTDTKNSEEKESEKQEESEKEPEEKEEKKDEKKEVDEPRAKRSRGESKKTDPPPPRSPAKRKAKA